MNSMQIQSIFNEGAKWKSCQLSLKYDNEIGGRIYDRNSITFDAFTLYIESNTGVIIIDIDSIYGIQLFTDSLEELMEKISTEVDEE